MNVRSVVAAFLLICVGALAAEAEPELFGIGAVLKAGDGRGPRIMSVLPNSPADKAKLIPDLIISRVGGIPTGPMGLAQCVELIRGEVGTKVSIELMDPTDGKTRVVELVRERLILPPG